MWHVILLYRIDAAGEGPQITEDDLRVLSSISCIMSNACLIIIAKIVSQHNLKNLNSNAQNRDLFTIY